MSLHINSNQSSRGRDRLYRLMPYINFCTNAVAMLPRGMRQWLYNRCRGISGKLGMAIRYILIRTLAKSCGFNVSIQKDVVIYHVDKISFGNNVSIHEMCYLDGSGGINIGNDVSIAHSTTIMSSSHVYTNEDRPIKDQGMEYKHSNICDNVWIGAKCTILAGNNIAEGCILGAGSVVTKHTNPNMIYGGVPAKLIKKRIISPDY